MAIPSTGDGPLRFRSRTRKALATTKARFPWRRRAARVVYKRSTADKKCLTEKRAQHRETYNEALEATSAAMQDQAESLKEKFGGHDVEYYMGEIMQRSRLSKGTRTVNKWNAYLCSEVRRINDGTSHVFVPAFKF